MLSQKILLCVAIVGSLVITSFAAGQSRSPEALPEPIAAGPFEPKWDSLMQYDQPQWFRDAKFGIWAHWSAIAARVGRLVAQTAVLAEGG